MQILRDLWLKITYAGTDEIKDDDLALGVTKGINILCAAIGLINIFAGPGFYFASKKTPVLWGSLVEAFLVFGIIWLNSRNKRELAKLSFYIVLQIATFYFGFSLGPTVEAEMMIVLMVGLAFFLFRSRKRRIFFITTTILLVVILEIYFVLNVLRTSRSFSIVTYAMRWAAISIIIFLEAKLFHLFDINYNRLLAKQNAHTRKVQRSLEEETQISINKSKIIRIASHEVKNQFRGVKLGLSVLANDSRIQNIPVIAEKLGSIVRAIEVVDMVMINVLNFAKGEAGVIETPLYEPFNLNKVLGGLVTSNQFEASRKKVNIVFMPSNDIPEYIHGDRFKINQIVGNILHNAIKFTRESTQVILKIEKYNNTYWKVSIKDEGEGIAPENQESIFEQFVTARNSDNIEGSGLGLPTAKTLIKALNGKIELQSTVGVGSTFSVYIPIVQNLTSSNAKDRGNNNSAVKVHPDVVN